METQNTGDGNKPFFETVKSFATVTISPTGVDTKEFLDAADGLVGLFDLISTTVFSFVQSDIKSNIAGIRSAYGTHPDECGTLESTVQRDIDEYEAEKRSSNGKRKVMLPEAKLGTGSVRRLIRGLYFTHFSLQHSLQHPDSTLYASFKQAYDTVLRHHHNFAIRTVVGVALTSTPTREVFYRKLVQGGDQALFEEEMKRWLDGLGGIVETMRAYLEERKELCGAV